MSYENVSKFASVYKPSQNKLTFTAVGKTSWKFIQKKFYTCLLWWIRFQSHRNLFTYL